MKNRVFIGHRASNDINTSVVFMASRSDDKKKARILISNPLSTRVQSVKLFLNNFSKLDSIQENIYVVDAVHNLNLIASKKLGKGEYENFISKMNLLPSSVYLIELSQ